ncbi:MULTISPECIES: nuclear transport factor 2 family protein [unclassified Nocardioides]|uniref:nuclear transport factor 2 family protein n=1 Tax=unclassified Nocardioides TaxID=2615069 RepID=UPI001A990397|nr:MULTISPECIES: nuclear transport factor 2 family protein [unclassified Nocardioides]
MTASISTAFFSAYNAHDAAAAAALYSADGTHEDVAVGHVNRGRQAIQEGLAHFLSCFPDAHWDVLGSIDAASASVGWYVLTGTLQEDFGPIAARGQALQIRGVQVMCHEGGVIQSTSDYWDLATFQRQMADSDR